MKILVVVNLCAPYRVGLFELLAKAHDIRFLFFSGGEERYYDGQRLLGKFRGEYLWGFNIGPKIRVNPKLLWELMFSDYTHIIVGINGPLPVFLSFVVSKLRRKKVVLWTGLWQHPGTLFHKMSFPVVKALYRWSDAIIVYGRHVKKYLTSLGIPSEKIAVAWQVQDNRKFEKLVTENQKEAKKKELGIKTTRVILYVGRLVEQKGIRLLLEAFKSLGNSDVSLALVGRGPLEDEIKRYASSRGKVFHVSRVPPEELYVYYAISDILVLPSITTPTIKETWGFVVNEGMCQGCAIITSDAVGAGVGGLVEPGANGFVIPEADSGALTVVLERMLGDKNMLEKMKARSREIIREWTYPKMASGFTEALAIADGTDNRK